MTMKIAGAVLLSCIGLAACANTGSGGMTSTRPTQSPIGVTASNGGGQRALGDIPSEGVNSVTGPTTGGVPNSKGNAY
jgi:hypothetical protein